MEKKNHGKKYISVTQLGMFEQCGVRYHFRYVRGIIAPPPIALLKGTGVHGGARENFRHKKEAHEDLPRKEIIECSVSAFEKAYSQAGEILPTPEEEAMGIKNAIGRAKDSVAALSGIFADQVAPHYQPIYVEEGQRIIVPQSNYDLLAVMDLADEQDVVMDLKTAGKSKTQRDVDTSEQLSFYALVFKALTKRLPREVRLEVLVDKKAPDVQRLSSARDDQDLQVLLTRISTMVKALDHNMSQIEEKTGKDFWIPADPSWWGCSPRYCGYWSMCDCVKH